MAHAKAYEYLAQNALGGEKERVFRLTSSELSEDGKIPRKYTVDGQGSKKDMSPPLEWYGVPDSARSLALIMEDVDAVVPWTHWVLVNIPPTVRGMSCNSNGSCLIVCQFACLTCCLFVCLCVGLPENFSVKNYDGDNEYSKIKEGVNDWKVPGYRGPCPPAGDHRYEIKLYALDDTLNLGNKVTKEKLLEAMEGHILDVAKLSCHYAKEKFESETGGYQPPGRPDPCGPGFPDVIKFPKRGTKTHPVYKGR